MVVLGIVVLLGVQTHISMAGHGIILDCSSLSMGVIALLNQHPTDMLDTHNWAANFLFF